jgi:hypothetical protein
MFLYYSVFVKLCPATVQVTNGCKHFLADHMQPGLHVGQPYCTGYNW